MKVINKKNQITGCILGTAVGDALGLNLEGLSRNRQLKFAGKFEKYGFLFGKGMVSDDTEHTCFVAESIIESNGDPKIFSSVLSRKLKLWMLLLPAGTGKATLKSVIKMLFGVPPEKSGVFSAGNGPAMRSPVLGIAYGDNIEKLKELVRLSTRMTHIDPKAEYGALAVAIAAHISAKNIENQEISKTFSKLLWSCFDEETESRDDFKEFRELIDKSLESFNNGDNTADFCDSIGLSDGVSGYVYHTVPVVIHCWLRNATDLKSGLIEIIRCGGDSDTTAAILGGIVGSGVGKNGIPDDLLENLCEWPRTVKWMEELACTLSSSLNGEKCKVPKVSFFKVLIRNLFFLCVVLTHGFRRLLPPY